MNDTFSDLISRLRNGQMANKSEIFVIKTKQNILFLDLLVEEGFIRGYKLIEQESNKVLVLLKYFQAKPAIQKIKRISKSNQRIYANVTTLWQLKMGFGNLILSTTKGLMTDDTARQLKIGGEVLVFIA